MKELTFNSFNEVIRCIKMSWAHCCPGLWLPIRLSSLHCLNPFLSLGFTLRKAMPAFTKALRHTTMSRHYHFSFQSHRIVRCV